MTCSKERWHGTCLAMDMTNEQQLGRFHSTSFGRASAVTKKPTLIVPIKMVERPVEFEVKVNVTDEAKGPAPAQTESNKQ